MKVFVSSVITGFERYRDAAERGAKVLGSEVKRSEDFGALPDSPQQACLAAVRWAEVVVLVLGSRYGALQPSRLSATHEEFRAARECCPVLVFVQQGVEREGPQDGFVKEVRDWVTGQSVGEFHTPEELQDAVTRALHRLEVARASAPVDEREMLERAMALVSGDRSYAEPMMTVAVAGGPRHPVLRPAEIEKLALRDPIVREAMFGEPRMFSGESAIASAVRDGLLVVQHGRASISVDAYGSVRVVQTPLQARPRGLVEPPMLPVLIEEDVQASIAAGLRFAGWLMDHVDPVRQLTHIATVAALHGGMGWKTRAEHERSPGTVVLGSTMVDRVVVHLSGQPRATLLQTTAALAEDLTVLLRREKKPRL